MKKTRSWQWYDSQAYLIRRESSFNEYPILRIIDDMICYLSGLGLASGWLSTWTPFSSVSTELPTDEDLYKQYYIYCMSEYEPVSECGELPTT